MSPGKREQVPCSKLILGQLSRVPDFFLLSRPKKGIVPPLPSSSTFAVTSLPFSFDSILLVLVLEYRDVANREKFPDDYIHDHILLDVVMVLLSNCRGEFGKRCWSKFRFVTKVNHAPR